MIVTGMNVTKEKGMYKNSKTFQLKIAKQRFVEFTPRLNLLNKMLILAG
jgi:hypothetical protein